MQTTAQKLAEAQAALEELPPAHRPVAMDLAERLRSMSVSVAVAADIAAKTGHRLHALANSEVCKVDDADPLSPDSLTALKGVGVLTKLANESLAPALNLLSANKERIQKLEEPEDDPDKPRGVLVVPGLIATPEQWSQVAQGKGGE